MNNIRKLTFSKIGEVLANYLQGILNIQDTLSFCCHVLHHICQSKQHNPTSVQLPDDHAAYPRVSHALPHLMGYFLYQCSSKADRVCVFSGAI